MELEIFIAFIAGIVVGVGLAAGWQFLKGKSAESATEATKEKLEQPLHQLSSDLEKVTNLVRDLENKGHKKFGEVATHLKTTNQRIQELQQTTSSLSEVLASPKKRGEWGERMAEDVLRTAGFKERVNYTKQETQKGGGRPDYTFLLPNDLKLNMDVKFPLDNYTLYIQSEGERDAEYYRKEFLKDVKDKIKELTKREYISPEEGTIDAVLLFVPNEQIYNFIEEQDSSIMEQALANKVIVCSPITLFAVLRVIRQAVDNFNLEQTADEILTLLSRFKKQWGSFVEVLEKLGANLDTVKNQYEELTTTRKNQLEKPLQEIENLRSQREIPKKEDSSEK